MRAISAASAACTASLSGGGGSASASAPGRCGRSRSGRWLRECLRGHTCFRGTTAPGPYARERFHGARTRCSSTMSPGSFTRVGVARKACVARAHPGARPGKERLCQGMRARMRTPSTQAGRTSVRARRGRWRTPQGAPRQLDAALMRGACLHIQPLYCARHRMSLSRARNNPDPSPGARAHRLASSSSASFVSFASNLCAWRATRSSRPSGSAPGNGPGAANRTAAPRPPAGCQRGGCPGIWRASACSNVGLFGPAVTAYLLTSAL